MNQRVVAEEVVEEVRRPAPISWGAVFAGLVFTLAIAWLLHLLGSALGLSIVDMTDAEAVGKGLAYGAAFWVLVSWAISFFLGGLLAGRLAGKADRAVGIMHGMTLWGVTTLLTVLLGVAGLTNLLQTAGSALRGGASLGAAAAGGAPGLGGPVGSNVAAGLQAELKQKVSEALAQAAQRGGPGAQVSQAEARRAVEQLDRQTLGEIAGALVRGDAEQAKRILAASTTLSRAEVNQIVDGLGTEAQRYQREAKDAADKAAGYSSAVLWAVFVSSAIGLVLAIIGGWMGAKSVARIYGYRFYEF